jgi:hypothetical protein
MMRREIFVVAALAPCLGACEDGFLPGFYAPPNQLPYACLELSDPVCDGVLPALEPAPNFSADPPIGLGARFDVSGGESLAPTRLVPIASGGFRADKLGLAAMVSHLGSTADLGHFEVREPFEIAITHETEAGLFTERVTTTALSLRYPEDRFRALLVDEDGNALSGSYACQWSSTDESVISIVSDPDFNLVTFRIEGSGQAKLSVELGDFVKDIDFNVTID